MVKLYQVGETLLSKCIADLLSQGVDVPAWKIDRNHIARTALNRELAIRSINCGALLEELRAGRISVEGLRLDPMHAIDVAVLQKSGVVLPVEVKFGRTIYSGERFVTRLVGAMSIGSDLRLKGSVPTILAAHSQDLLPHLAKVELAGSTFPLEKEWGIAIIRDQFTKVQDLISKNQDSRVNEAEVTWPSGLRYILVYEEIRDALGARFEDIVFSLWPPHGSASGTLL